MHGFLILLMVRRVIGSRRLRAWPLAGLMWLFAGCYYAGFYFYNSNGGGTESALGEEHEVNYPAHDTLILTEDALRGKGVLFEVKPENSIATLWQKADNPGGVLPGLVGVSPQYRYEIQVVAEGANKSKIIVNARTEDIPDDQLDHYKASARLDLFNEIDRVASLTPPPSVVPRTGGVNFALLPNEDLKGLAMRVTGDSNNWQSIAKDNGISSASDVTPFQTIWVRNDFLKNAPKQPSASSTP